MARLTKAKPTGANTGTKPAFRNSGSARGAQITSVGPENTLSVASVGTGWRLSKGKLGGFISLAAA